MNKPNKRQKTHLRKGHLIGDRYEIESRIGHGGMATVYKAWDRFIRRPVALKIMTPATNNEEEQARRMRRFEREAHMAARLNHPNVVTLFDVGAISRDRPFLVLELLVGKELGQLLNAEGAMPPERTLQLFLPMLGALSQAHELGIVHKDLKPANLYVDKPDTDKERLVILDFGVASWNRERRDRRLTDPELVLGTPEYMAPEYIRDREVTPTMDVYQAGLIMAEMLVGRQLMTGDDPTELMTRHMEEGVPIPDEILQGPFAQVIQKALARDATQRFPDAGALSKQLKAVETQLLRAMPEIADLDTDFIDDLEDDTPSSVDVDFEALSTDDAPAEYESQDDDSDDHAPQIWISHQADNPAPRPKLDDDAEDPNKTALVERPPLALAHDAQTSPDQHNNPNALSLNNALLIALLLALLALIFLLAPSFLR